MKRLFTIAGALYVAFALFTSYCAVGSPPSVVPYDLGQGHVVDETGKAVPDNQRSDNPDPRADIDTTTVADAKDEFTITVYTASWCGPCAIWKKRELPALLKAGYKVEVLDIDEVDEPASVKAVPTVMVSRKGKVLEIRNYWTAESIIEYIEKQLSLKGAS